MNIKEYREWLEEMISRSEPDDLDTREIYYYDCACNTAFKQCPDKLNEVED